MADGKVENTNTGKAVVSNPLLSGAGVTFPYEHFQGTSLLVPVPQPPEPLLIQDEGEVDTFVGQEPSAAPQPIPQQPERPPSASQKYSGLFSSFFGAITTQEAPPEKTAEQASVSSTPRSYSPFVHVPNVTSYSPALFVPEDKTDVTASVSSAPPAALPPPPTSQFVPLTGNLYRQQPRQAVAPPKPTTQRHFIPVSEPVVQRPATADSLVADALEDNAGSTSSSNDSIVADLQSRFATTHISNPPPPIPVSGQQAAIQPPTAFYGQNFDNSSDLVKTDHSFLESSGRDFHESFGAIGQPVLHPGSENESHALTQTTHFTEGSWVVSEDHSRQSYGVPWQGFGQVSVNTEDAFKIPPAFKQPESETPVQENKTEPISHETFYQRALTEESLEQSQRESEFYSQPNSNADVRDSPSIDVKPQEASLTPTSVQQPSTQEAIDQFAAAKAFQQPTPGFSGVPLNQAGLSQITSSGVSKFRRGGLNRRPVYAQVPGLSSGAPQENIFTPQPTTTPAQIFNPTLFQSAVVTDSYQSTSTPSPFNPYAPPDLTVQNTNLNEGATFPSVPLEVSRPPTSVFASSSPQPPATLPILPPASQPVAPVSSAPPPLFGEAPQQNTPIFSTPTPTQPPILPTPPSSFFEQAPPQEAPGAYSLFQPTAPTSYAHPTFPFPEVSSVASAPEQVQLASPVLSSVPLASSPPVPASEISGTPLSVDPTAPIQQSVPNSSTLFNQPPTTSSEAPAASLFSPSSFFQPPSSNPQTVSPPAFTNSPADPLVQPSNASAFYKQPQPPPPQFFQPEPASTPSSVSSFGASSPAQLSGFPFGQELKQGPYSPPSSSSSITNFFNSPPLLQPTQQLFSQTTEPNSFFSQPNPEHQNPVFPEPKAVEPFPLPQNPTVPEPASFLAPNTSDFFSGSTVPQASALFDPAPQSMATPPDQYLLNTVDLSTPPRPARTPSPSVVPQRLLNLGQSGIIYRPPYFHWFWNSDASNKESWQPFSMADSMELEQAFNSGNLTMDTIVPTDGGRYDVAVVARRRDAVYWNEPPKDVRRCSWFHRKSTESKPTPYDENTAYTLEEAYKAAVQSGTWHRRVELPEGEHVIMYGPTSITHSIPSTPAPDSWEAATEGGQGVKRMWVVKRGVDEFEIDDGESPVVDHVLFVVHGIGSACDLKFRTIEEAVNDFRQTSHQLVRTHYRTSMEQGEANRVEVLPVSWHESLHEETGVDEKIKKITLKSIPKLRNFTNDTLLDILFYTSPVYCQKIIDQVAHELNRLYGLFKRRNPTFHGSASVAGHSLGSLILFDMLCHQKRSSQKPDERGDGEGERRLLTRTGSYMTGTAGTGQPYITYPQLDFHPNSFFAMGSPIGMFVTVRGIDSLGIDFKLPTCPGLFNIFHPFDPVAYRLEALINPDLATQRPVLIPHHKGRKRMHLELRETMARVGADLKQRVFDTVRTTWNAVYQLTSFGRSDEAIRQEVDEAIATSLTPRLRTESSCEDESESVVGAANGLNVGVVIQGRRVDYVLQEAPLESFNEYVSAITSHVCYWDSEDTVLFILKDIYTNMGVAADSAASIAEAAAAEERDPSGPPSPPSPSGFIDPAAHTPLQPPPMGGFVRK